MGVARSVTMTGVSLLAWIAILLCCTSSTDAKILQGKELLQQFQFTKLQQSKLPWKLPLNSNSTASKAVFSKLLASNSPALRPTDWTYERWLQQELLQSRRRAEAIAATAYTRASAYVTWLESKNLQPSSRLQREFAAGSGSGTLTSSTVVAAPLSSEFYTVLEIGTPAQPTVLIIDTGSELTWLQCQPCAQCFNQTSSKIFDPANSSTYAAVACTDAVCAEVDPIRTCSGAGTCQYAIAYLDGSYTRGAVATDAMTTEPVPDNGSSAGASLVDFVFGCGTTQRFTTVIGVEAGILGMNRGSLSLPTQLGAHEFAYCLPDRFTATDPGSGYIYLGWTNETRREAGGLAFLETPLLINPLLPDIYYIGVTGVSVGGARVPVPAAAFDLQNNGTGGTIVDSGTTVTLLVDAVYGPVMAALETATAGLAWPRAPEVELAVGLGLCYSVRPPGEAVGEVPSFVFHLAGGADWELPVGNYFIPVLADRSVFCYAFFRLERSPFSIISNTQQQNTVVVHDLANNKFSISGPADCDVGS